MDKQVFEQSGLIPRSIIRTFDRFRRQLLPGSETIVIQEFRVSRYQVLVSVRSLITLLVIPLLINFLLKRFLLTPLTEFYWNNYQTEIFLNSYQQNHALKEIQNFEEKLFFEQLIDENVYNSVEQQNDPKKAFISDKEVLPYQLNSAKTNILFEKFTVQPKWSDANFKQVTVPDTVSSVQVEEFTSQEEVLKKIFQQKTIELAFEYNQQSIIAVTNVFGDFVTVVTIFILFIFMKPQIIILKSFLIESIYSLSDTTKSFLLIFFTDLLVGFHSPRGWDLVLEIFLRHFGLPENQDFILLFVATFPVLLDTVFKYWIFRYLNKISPSTVATYHNMIE